jgi:hypothetical protein
MNNPIVRFHYSLSAPCVLNEKPFVQRMRTIQNIYREVDDCNGYFIQSHSQYYETGFSQLEYNVYQDNGILETIEKTIPFFNPHELR